VALALTSGLACMWQRRAVLSAFAEDDDKMEMFLGMALKNGTVCPDSEYVFVFLDDKRRHSLARLAWYNHTNKDITTASRHFLRDITDEQCEVYLKGTSMRDVDGCESILSCALLSRSVLDTSEDGVSDNMKKVLVRDGDCFVVCCHEGDDVVKTIEYVNQVRTTFQLGCTEVVAVLYLLNDNTATSLEKWQAVAPLFAHHRITSLPYCDCSVHYMEVVDKLIWEVRTRRFSLLHDTTGLKAKERALPQFLACRRSNRNSTAHSSACSIL